MAIQRKGRFFVLILLVVLLSYRYSASVFAVSDSMPILYDAETEARSEYGREEALLHKTEELVEHLAQVVARLEAKLSESSVLPGLENNPIKQRDGISQRKFSERKANEEEEKESEGRRREGGKGRAFSVTKYSPFWSERFQFVSAVKLDSDATSVNVLPFRDYEGQIKYFAIGDSRGRVYVFLRNGDVLVEFYTTCNSPITSMVLYLSVYKNETLVVTGHLNGEILLHRVYEGSSNKDWNSVWMENVGKFSGTGNGEDGRAVTFLEAHHVGRKTFILATDLSGQIRVFTENGTIYGSVMPTSRTLVFLKQRLLFLTETGAGSLDLRTMKIRESECEGLNSSLARTYVFYASERSKAYGFTSEGEIVHVLLLGDTLNFKCRVRSKRKIHIEEPVAFQAIKGYMLIVSQENVLVYNVSTQHYVRSGGPRLLFSADLDEIRSSFLNSQDSNKIGKQNKPIPLIASDGDKLLVLGLGGGYVAVYRSKLPVFKGEFNTMPWSPVFFFLLFLSGTWHFFAKKKEAPTSWGPDDPFPSPRQTASRLVQSPDDRSFVESSRRSDEILGLRRYGFPSRYSADGGGAEPSSRTPVDPRYRAAAGSELKFRGSAALESSGFGKRRESFLVNSEVLHDEN